MSKVIEKYMVLFMILLFSFLGAYNILTYNTNIQQSLYFINSKQIIYILVSIFIMVDCYAFFYANNKIFRSIIGVLNLMIFGIYMIHNSSIIQAITKKNIICFTFALFGMLISSGNIAKSLVKERNDGYLAYLMSVITVWQLLCLEITLGKEFNKNVAFLTLSIIGALLFLLLWLYSETINFKTLIIKIKEFTKDDLIEFLILIIPIYLFKSSWIKMGVILVIYAAYIFIKYNIDDMFRFERNVHIFSLLFITWVVINYFINKENGIIYNDYKHTIEPYIYLMAFMNLNLKEKYYNKILISGTLISLIPSLGSIFILIGNKYAPGIYAVGYPSNWAATAALLAGFFTYICLFFHRTEIGVMIIITTFSMTLTGSRGSVCGYIISSGSMIITYFMLNKNSIKKHLQKTLLKILICTLICSTMLYLSRGIIFRLATERNEISIILKPALWKEAIEQISEKPFVGNGYNNLNKLVINSKEKIENSSSELEKLVKSDVYNASHSFNNILELLRGYGIIGFILYLSLHFCIFVYFIYYYIKRKKIIFLLPVFMYILLEIAGLVDITMISTQYQILFFFFVGLAFMRIKNPPTLYDQPVEYERFLSYLDDKVNDGPECVKNHKNKRFVFSTWKDGKHYFIKKYEIPNWYGFLTSLHLKEDKAYKYVRITNRIKDLGIDCVLPILVSRERLSLFKVKSIIVTEYSGEPLDCLASVYTEYKDLFREFFDNFIKMCKNGLYPDDYSLINAYVNNEKQVMISDFDEYKESKYYKYTKNLPKSEKKLRKMILNNLSECLFEKETLKYTEFVEYCKSEIERVKDILKWEIS